MALLIGWISGAIALFVWYGNQYGQSGWFSIACLIALLAGPVILILLIKRFEPESTVTILTEDDQHPRFRAFQYANREGEEPVVLRRTIQPCGSRRNRCWICRGVDETA
ncbi:MAG: hypothetical protein ACFHWZ_05060 [Phycisphaerales bacterium]